VLWTDYNTALVGECLRTADDGSCMPGYGAVMAYARRAGDLGAAAREQLVRVARRACLDEEDFVATPHEGKGAETPNFSQGSTLT
jgi:hypothetical protein